jgi:excisionase family DNA binding protein
MVALLDLKSAARLLGISHWTVRAFLKKGVLRPVRIGRRVLIEEAELRRFVNEAKAKWDDSKREEVNAGSLPNN